MPLVFDSELSARVQFVIPCAANDIELTDTLADGATSVPYTGIVVASGGVGPLRISLDTGALPTGLSLSTDGLLTGTPTVAAMFNFTLMAVDTAGCSATAAYAILIA